MVTVVVVVVEAGVIVLIVVEVVVEWFGTVEVVVVVKVVVTWPVVGLVVVVVEVVVEELVVVDVGSGVIAVGETASKPNFSEMRWTRLFQTGRFWAMTLSSFRLEWGGRP